ncbi:MAG: peptidoglycan recognition protein family protein [bacterium]
MDPSLPLQAAVADTLSKAAQQTVLLKPLLAVLTVALGLSLTVERVLEFVNRLLNRFFFRGDAPAAKERVSVEQQVDRLVARVEADHLDRAAEDLAETQDRLAREGDALTPLEKAEVEMRLSRARTIDSVKLEQAENFSEATILVEPATPIPYEETNRKFWMQTFGTFIGIGLCFYADLGIFKQLFQYNSELAVLDRIDQLFSGILIGAGSQPVHFLINYITQRKIQSLKSDPESAETGVTMAAEKPMATAVVAPGNPPVANARAVPVTRAGEINVPYTGGVDRELLQHRHRREADPNLIVYHHTSMHSGTSFAEVVKIIKDKGWLTGYHCVVLQDGSIHAFCRWDRYGSHVQGHNRRSLGLALNGNFETDPRIPFANVNGRFGEPKPTDEQLHAAARVAALWCHVYAIPLNWHQSILPHRELSATRCPGSNFPLPEFRKLIQHYHTQWSSSASARDELELYRQKPYLFVKA